MNEDYLELLAEYAARQMEAKIEKTVNAPRVEQARKVKQEKRVGARAGEIVKSARRSAAVHDAYRHALLLALGGRSAAQLTASEEN
ncbi:MAG: hypothetical protein V1817_01060 [Candidatus Micrarchaeota archaeon]